MLKLIILSVIVISVTACSSTLANKQTLPSKVDSLARDRN